MKNQLNKPSNHSINFANLVLVAGIIFFFLIFLYSLFRIINYQGYFPTFYYLSIIIALLFSAIFFFVLLKIGNELKANIAVLITTIFLSLFSFETYLQFQDIGKYDTRSKMDVLNDLNKLGINAYPNIFPKQFVKSDGLGTVNNKIFPLGGIPNVTTVYNNEGGFWVIYDTDENGFNNQKGIYESENVQILLIGDSFTEGSGVAAKNSISAVLRRGGLNSLSVGKGSNGPLLEFATLKEYGEPIKPKIILWLYWINDLDDLKIELESKFLKNYLLKDDFSQNLISRKDEIKEILINYVKNEWSKSDKDVKKNWKNFWMFKIARLYNIREKIKFIPKSKAKSISIQKPTPIFKEILLKANKMVSNWGGKMYFIYLPSFDMYADLNSNEYINRNYLLEDVNNLDIPIIDIHKEVFLEHLDPLSLFPFKMNGHYNEEGYRLTAEAIINRLKLDIISK